MTKPRKAPSSLVEAFVSEAAVEALDETALHRLAGSDGMPLDTRFLATFEDSHTGHLCPVVRDDLLRLSPSSDEAIQLAGKHVDWTWNYVRFYMMGIGENAQSMMGADPSVRVADLIIDAAEQGATMRKLTRVNSTLDRMMKRDQEEVIWRLS